MSAIDPRNPRNTYTPPPDKQRGEWITVRCTENDPRLPYYDVTILTTLPLPQLDRHVNNWAKRTATFTAASLARYISKHTNFFAITQSQYVTQISKLPTKTNEDEQK
jgi:hypothetical protein